jgi:hypothetical protein
MLPKYHKIKNGDYYISSVQLKRTIFNDLIDVGDVLIKIIDYKGRGKVQVEFYIINDRWLGNYIHSKIIRKGFRIANNDDVMLWNL